MRPLWRRFALYLERRAQGRRSEALTILEEFVKLAENWPFENRRSLLLWLGEKNEFRPFGSILIPQPLMLRVVVPTASEYLACDPHSSRANFLYAIFAAPLDAKANPLEYLRNAVDLDPTQQAARMTFINWVAGHVENAQHELPWHGYLGTAADDKRDLQDALAMATGIANAPFREELIEELTGLLETASAWDSFEQTGGTDFPQWCTENGIPASLVDRL